MRRLALAMLVAAVSLPAAAQEDRLALFAKVVGGLADGGETLIGSLGKGKITMVGDGAFDIALKDGVAHFLFDEPDTCVFGMHSSMANQPASNARFDATKFTGIEVRDQGEWEGLKAVLVTISGPDGMLQVEMNGGWVNQPAFAFLASNLTADEVKAAADELMRIC